LHGSLHELNNNFLFFRATPKRRKVFVLQKLHGSLHELSNDFLFFRATPKRRKVFVLHALHGTLHKFYKRFFEQHVSVARYLFYMRCMAHYINFIKILRATPKRRKVFVLHALHGSLHELNNDFLFSEHHLSVARYLFYMRCMVHYMNWIMIFLPSNT
jgi:hypothetical protein